jgi:hypothetical protein
MLTVPIDYMSSPVEYYQDTEQRGLIKSFLSGIGQSFQETWTQSPYESVDTFVDYAAAPEQQQPLRDYASFITPQDQIPSALSIPLTDKVSNVYMDTPKTKPLINKTKEDFLPYTVMDYASITPATMSLEQVQLTPNQLQANYADTTTSVSGHEQVLTPFLLAASTQEDNTTADDVAKSLPAPFNSLSVFTDKDVRNQTFVFIIGAILLAIGIFALTR